MSCRNGGHSNLAVFSELATTLEGDLDPADAERFKDVRPTIEGKGTGAFILRDWRDYDAAVSALILAADRHAH